jgi:hypothetical protein
MKYLSYFKREELKEGIDIEILKPGQQWEQNNDDLIFVIGCNESGERIMIAKTLRHG